MAFLSPSELCGRARGNSNLFLPASGPGAETTNFPCTLNPRAAGLELVARVVIYLWMSQRPVENASSR